VTPEAGAEIKRIARAQQAQHTHKFRFSSTGKWATRTLRKCPHRKSATVRELFIAHGTALRRCLCR
jgi:hypothetical protein